MTCLKHFAEEISDIKISNNETHGPVFLSEKCTHTQQSR